MKLYNPRNWWFVTFFLGPLPTVICYSHNIKVLGNPKKGRIVLIGGLLFAVGLVALTFLFKPWGFLTALGLQLFATWYAAHVAKKQIPVYDARVKADPSLGNKKMWPIVVVFVGVQLLLIFVLPEALARYVEKNYIPVKFGGETIYVPRIEDVPDSPAARLPPPTSPHALRIALPEGYVLSEPKSDLFDEDIVRYTFDGGPALDDEWDVLLIPLAAMKRVDDHCAPGDCLRDTDIYPIAGIWNLDAKAFLDGQWPFTLSQGGRLYAAQTTRVTGDVGYRRNYWTYVDGVRVVLISPWFLNRDDGLSYDDFLGGIGSMRVE